MYLCILVHYVYRAGMQCISVFLCIMYIGHAKAANKASLIIISFIFIISLLQEFLHNLVPDDLTISLGSQLGIEA